MSAGKSATSAGWQELPQTCCSLPGDGRHLNLVALIIGLGFGGQLYCYTKLHRENLRFIAYRLLDLRVYTVWGLLGSCNRRPHLIILETFGGLRGCCCFLLSSSAPEVIISAESGMIEIDS